MLHRTVRVTVTEPSRVQSAIASIWSASLAVMATVRLDFAATTAIALGIVELIKFPCVVLAQALLL